LYSFLEIEVRRGNEVAKEGEMRMVCLLRWARCLWLFGCMVGEVGDVEDQRLVEAFLPDGRSGWSELRICAFVS
jgi:hypothetical protein